MSGRAFGVADVIEYANNRPSVPSWARRDSAERYGLSAIERSALLCLWDHAHYWRESAAAPRLVLSDWSQPQLAREIPCSSRAVRYALDRLETLGLIAVHVATLGVPVVYRLAELPPAPVRLA